MQNKIYSLLVHITYMYLRFEFVSWVKILISIEKDKCYINKCTVE